jgi:hypothetical protein
MESNMQSQFNCRLAANKLLVFPMVALLLVLFPPAAYPADESGEIMTVVDQFFQALEERNGALLEEILYPSSLNISATAQSEGGSTLTARSYEDLLERFSSGQPIIERYWNHTLLVRGAIAIFWAPYDLYLGRDFSHCSVDSFQLVKEEGRWWLTNLSWTIERESCELHPDGPRFRESPAEHT